MEYGCGEAVPKLPAARQQIAQVAAGRRAGRVWSGRGGTMPAVRHRLLNRWTVLSGWLMPSPGATIALSVLMFLGTLLMTDYVPPGAPETWRRARLTLVLWVDWPRREQSACCVRWRRSVGNNASTTAA